MNLAFYANLAEIIGTTAIVVSLIYVAIQIHQNNQHLAQGAQRARAQAVRDNLGVLRDNVEIVIKDQADETLSASEAFSMNTVWMGVLFSYQTSFQQLPRNELEGHARFIGRFFQIMPSLRLTWEQNRDTYHPDFVQFMEENVVNER
jgi:hypothetical protein